MFEILKKYQVIFATILFMFSSFQVIAREESPSFWYKEGQSTLKKALQIQQNKKQARNIILFVGDGMGITNITAARILSGQKEGSTGEEHSLAFEKLPYVGLSKTYNTNQQVPDSAGTMSAMMTGVKTKAGFISVNQNAKRSNCKSAKGNDLKTLLEEMEERGFATGIVTTTKITHATPAASYAHVPERGWEADTDMSMGAIKDGCKDIAQQLIEFNYGDGIDVILGGGRSKFLAIDDKDPEYPTHKTGVREDDRNLIQEWQQKYSLGKYVWNAKQFDAIKISDTNKLLGLFEPDHMRYNVDRHLDPGGEPELKEMVDKAIQLLQKNEKGFFLIVEAGRIDHAHHIANAHLALNDTLALSNAVNRAQELIDLEETLLIVTADHSHVFTMAGYPIRGNPILSKVQTNRPSTGGPWPEYALADDGLPYTTLGYLNGGRRLHDETHECHPPYCKVRPHRNDLSEVDTEAREFVHQTLIPMATETHGGEDVAIYAGGPWAHLFHGVHEQNYIYHVMRHAIHFDNK